MTEPFVTGLFSLAAAIFGTLLGAIVVHILDRRTRTLEAQKLKLEIEQFKIQAATRASELAAERHETADLRLKIDDLEKEELERRTAHFWKQITDRAGVTRPPGHERPAWEALLHAYGDLVAEREQRATLTSLQTLISRLRALDDGPGLSEDHLLQALHEIMAAEDQARAFRVPETAEELRRLGSDLLRRSLQPNMRLPGIRLARIDLGDMALSNVGFSGAELPQANLRHADLRGANLQAADLDGAWLSLADLTGAQLQGASLRDAVLLRANLRGANLDRADLTGAALAGADLTGASLDNAILAGARYEQGGSEHTRWPAGFDPVAAGAIATGITVV